MAQVYKVNKECVIEGDYYESKDAYRPSNHMSWGALQALVKHGFLIPKTTEAAFIRGCLSNYPLLTALLRGWVAYQRSDIKHITVSRRYDPLSPDLTNGYRYIIKSREENISMEISSATTVTAFEQWPAGEYFSVEELGLD